MNLYWVNIPSHGHTLDDGRRVEAYDAESAAEVYVERCFDSLDYPLELVVRVFPITADGTPDVAQAQDFEVTVESVPSFSAEPVRPARGEVA